MNALSQPGSISAPADIAKTQFPIRMPAERVAFDVSRVEALLGNAVAQENDAIAVVNEELSGAGDGLGKEDCDDESSNTKNNRFGHALRFCVGPNSASIFS